MCCVDMNRVAFTWFRFEMLIYCLLFPETTFTCALRPGCEVSHIWHPRPATQQVYGLIL